jgi:hypothetical protein
LRTHAPQQIPVEIPCSVILLRRPSVIFARQIFSLLRVRLLNSFARLALTETIVGAKTEAVPPYGSELTPEFASGNFIQARCASSSIFFRFA